MNRERYTVRIRPIGTCLLLIALSGFEIKFEFPTTITAFHSKSMSNRTQVKIVPSTKAQTVSDVVCCRLHICKDEKALHKKLIYNIFVFSCGFKSDLIHIVGCLTTKTINCFTSLNLITKQTCQSKTLVCNCLFLIACFACCVAKQCNIHIVYVDNTSTFQILCSLHKML